MKSLALIVAALASRALAQTPDAATPAVFTDKCAGCHAADGSGQTMYGHQHKMPDFSSTKWQKANHPQEALVKTITEGVTTHAGKHLMPAFGEKLTGDQIAALAQYVLTAFKAP